MTPADLSRTIGALLYDSLNTPETVDVRALLVASDQFLRDTRGLTCEIPDAARTMALRAFEWALFGGDDAHTRLHNATTSWYMLTGLAKFYG